MQIECAAAEIQRAYIWRESCKERGHYVTEYSQNTRHITREIRWVHNDNTYTCLPRLPILLTPCLSDTQNREPELTIHWDIRREIRLRAWGERVPRRFVFAAMRMKFSQTEVKRGEELSLVLRRKCRWHTMRHARDIVPPAAAVAGGRPPPTSLIHEQEGRVCSFLYWDTTPACDMSGYERVLTTKNK